MLEDLALIIKIAFSWYSLLAYAIFGLFLLLLKRIVAEPKTFDHIAPPPIQIQEADEKVNTKTQAESPNQDEK